MKRLILFLLPILLFACSEEFVDMNDASTSTEKIQPRSGGDGKYDALGYGYDVTYEYFNASPQSMKAQVIDVDAYVESGGKWDFNSNPSTYNDMIAGSTTEDFVSQLTIHGDIKMGADVFTGSLEANFSSYYEYSSKYSIAQYFMYIRQKQLYLNASTSELIPYLSSKFKEDLQTKSSSYIIEHYGTHVLTNIVLGARLTVTYRSLATSETSAKREAVTAGCSSNVLSIFQINVSTSYRDSLVTKNKEQLLTYKTEGGDPSKSLVGTFNLDSSVTPQVDISSWQNSCNTSNMVLIDAVPGTVIPLYEFVSDAAKRNELKDAIEKYAKERSYVDAGTIVPLYQYSYKVRPGRATEWQKEYCYTTDFNIYGNGKDGYTYEKILCYVFASSSHPTAAIPVYQYVTTCYTSGRYGDLREVPHYAINWDKFKQGDEYTKYKGVLCYIYPVETKGENLVNLYFNHSSRYSLNIHPSRGEKNSFTAESITDDSIETTAFIGKGIEVKPVQ